MLEAKRMNLLLKIPSVKFSSKVPSFVIHSDNKDEKVTAVEVYERGFRQINTELTHSESTHSRNQRPNFRGEKQSSS